MDVAGEGSAIDLAETRTITYGARKKIFITSTPTRKGASAIDAEFETTGQRYYHVPCPHCAVRKSWYLSSCGGKKGSTKMCNMSVFTAIS
jgi:phage terminase large subunit GpA-like protein